VRGFRAALERFPGVRITATICGDYLREPGARVIAQLLNSGARFDAILAANDEMALGALDALKAAGRTSTVVGVNAIPDAITAIKTGDLLATADFNTLRISEIATEAAIRHLRGEALPKDIILPVEIVDRTNHAAWDKAFEQREPVRWDETVGV
jgi:ribose transport system substrate-binding protein